MSASNSGSGVGGGVSSYSELSDSAPLRFKNFFRCFFSLFSAANGSFLQRTKCTKMDYKFACKVPLIYQVHGGIFSPFGNT